MLWNKLHISIFCYYYSEYHFIVLSLDTVSKSNGEIIDIQVVVFVVSVPSKEPQNFLTVSDTHDSADLTWKQISYEHLHGFLTHYKLCTVKINSQSKPPGLEDSLFSSGFS